MPAGPAQVILADHPVQALMVQRRESLLRRSQFNKAPPGSWRNTLANKDDMTISRLETGVRAPSLDQLERLARVFEVPISHFLNEDTDPLFIRGREIASLLALLSKEQQSFVNDFVRLYIEAHGKKPRADSAKHK